MLKCNLHSLLNGNMIFPAQDTVQQSHISKIYLRSAFSTRHPQRAWFSLGNFWLKGVFHYLLRCIIGSVLPKDNLSRALLLDHSSGASHDQLEKSEIGQSVIFVQMRRRGVAFNYYTPKRTQKTLQTLQALFPNETSTNFCTWQRIAKNNDR